MTGTDGHMPRVACPPGPIGFDAARQRLTFCCMKQCLKLKAPGIRNLDNTYDIKTCKHLKKTCGYGA
jgi:hypothetical protein